MLVTVAPVRIGPGERERIKDFKRAYLAMSLAAMLLVCVFFSTLTPSSPLLSLLLISDAASQFNGHYDQIPGRDRGGSKCVCVGVVGVAGGQSSADPVGPECKAKEMSSWHCNMVSETARPFLPRLNKSAASAPRPFSLETLTRRLPEALDFHFPRLLSQTAQSRLSRQKPPIFRSSRPTCLTSVSPR